MTNTKKAFAKRLNAVLDAQGVPPLHYGRYRQVAQMFGVTERGARKWLEAERFPELDKLAEISKKLKVSIGWLVRGIGDMAIEDPPQVDAGALTEVILAVDRVALSNGIKLEPEKLGRIAALLYQERESHGGVMVDDDQIAMMVKIAA